jgi:hypothetical protein
VPLNENEQRILAEIERQFHSQNPKSAELLASTTLQRYLARKCKWAALGSVVGLAVLLAAFAFSWVLAVVGFLIMLSSAIVLVTNLIRISRLGVEQMTQTIRSRNPNQSLAELARKFRERFGGDGRI